MYILLLSILIEISGYMYSKKYGIEDKRASILYLASMSDNILGGSFIAIKI